MKNKFVWNKRGAPHIYKNSSDDFYIFYFNCKLSQLHISMTSTELKSQSYETQAKQRERLIKANWLSHHSTDLTSLSIMCVYFVLSQQVSWMLENDEMEPVI